MSQDYYQLLGVDKGASQAELKKAYRKMAMKYHPDRNPDNQQAADKFKEINEAYDVLKNEQKRAQYDRYGKQAFTGGGGHSGFGGGAGVNPDDLHDIFSDFFGDLGGGGRSRRNNFKQPGSDLRYNISVSLEEAYKGVDKIINFRSAVKCTDCNGTGSKTGKAPRECPHCHGSGRLRAQQGFFVVERTCHHCNGTGYELADPCPTCFGHGRVERSRELEVKIPAGIDDQAKIRLTGEGEAGLRGGQAGSLFLFVTVKNHDFFSRNGNNLLCRVPVKMATAVLGGEIDVPTIEGTMATVKIPQGTQSGTNLRLRGKGMPLVRGSSRGDMAIEVKIELPVNLTERQKELLVEFDTENQDDSAHPEMTKFFKKIKTFWKKVTD